MKRKNKILIIGGSGYVGSRLCEYFLNDVNFKIHNIDINKGKYPKITKKSNYNKLSSIYLNRFNFILILAAHSSTKQCAHDEIGAIKNNVTDLKELLIKIKFTKAIPIFISTTAVYNNLNKIGSENLNLSNRNFLNLYDISKRFIEIFILKNLKKFYILRLGTVSGKSPNQNKNLIINKMYFDSINKKKIYTISENSKKSILFINDLCESLKLIFLSKKNFYGIYNINSFNMTVGKIAKTISKITGANIIKNKGISGYSFFSSNKKFDKKFNFKFTKNIETILINLGLNKKNDNSRIHS